MWRSVLASVLIAACSTPASTASSPSPIVDRRASPISSPTVTPSPTATPFPAAPPHVANKALLDFARMAGRSDPAICLYVDPATGADSRAALRALQSTVDALIAQGYAPLGARPVAPCSKAPGHIAHNTVHPKNSSRGPGGSVETVQVASPYQVFFVLTTASRIDHIFGGLSFRTSTEEAMFKGDNGWGVTQSVYVDAPTFADPVKRAYALFDGLGLLQRS